MRHATVRQLRVFDAAARQLSFTRAAGALHLTQPAVSIQIRDLERHVGFPLFERVGRRLFLTPSGVEALRHARAILERYQEAEEAIALLRGEGAGRLRLAVISAGNHFVPRLLAEFLRREPRVQPELNVHNRDEVLRALRENVSDLAIMGRPPEEAALAHAAFAAHPYGIVARADHPLAARRRIKWPEIAALGLVVREHGSDSRLALEETSRERGVAPAIAMEIRSNETIRQLVVEGLGVAFLSLHTMTVELHARTLVALDVEGFPVMRSWHLVHLRDKQLAPTAERFKAFLAAEGGTILERLLAPRGRRRA